MSAPHPIQLPGESLPHGRTVRSAYYVRAVLYHAIPFAAFLWLWLGLLMISALKESPAGAIVATIVMMPVSVLLVPSAVVIYRLLKGTKGRPGILAAAEASKAWRARWKEIQQASLDVQRKCRLHRSMFALPGSRGLLLEEEESWEYERPESVLKDIPEGLYVSTCGNETNQPLQVIEAGSTEKAAAVMQRIAALVAGRLLGREIPFVVFKFQGPNWIHLQFLTAVDPEGLHRSYIWTVLQVKTNGTTVGGFVQTIRNDYFGRGVCSDGYHYHGDEVHAGRSIYSVGYLALMYSPPGLFLVHEVLKEQFFELFHRKVSSQHFFKHGPDNGDTVDLSLIGESGSGIYATAAFSSRVEGIRSDILQEVHKVTGTFAGVLAEY